MTKKTIIDGEYALVRGGFIDHAINNGEVYSYTRQETVSVGVNSNAVFTTGDNPVDAYFEISSDEKVDVSVHESPVSTLGTDDLGAIVNRNRTRSDAQSLITSLVVGADISDRGVLLGGSMADKWGGNSSALKMRLKPNTTYSIELLFDKNNATMYAGFKFAEGY